MADMMNQGAMNKGGANAIKNNMSIFNPTDIAAMSQGELGQGLQNAARQGKELTIADGLNMLGLRPEDPLQKLIDFGMKNIQNANPVDKFKNIAKETGGGQPPTGQPPTGGGMQDLMQG